jgi:hypothetical protein
MQTALQGVKDFGIGAVKGAAHTAIDLGSAVHMIPGVSTLVDKAYGTPGLSQAAFPAAREATAYSNPTQQLGGAAETVAEMAVPVDAGVQALPSAARAGAKFKGILAAGAGNLPVDVSKTGNAALRVAELAQHGGGTEWGPAPVRQLIQYLTNPKKPELTYSVGRDFASNISRLSAKEWQSINPQIGAEVAGVAAELNRALAETAQKVGQGQAYVEAMREYAKAKQLQGIYTAFLKGAQRTAPYATAAGAGAYLYHKISSVLGQ